MKIARLAVVTTAALALTVGSFGMTGAEDKKDHVAIPAGFGEDEAPRAEEVPAVVITGGTITNTTTLDIVANGGTGIADASGGSNNVAVTGEGGGDGVSDVASAGNGGGAVASANGGAVSVGDVNSGGNAGNAIIVGNTNAGVEEVKPEAKPDEGKKVIDEGKKVVDYGKPAGDNGGGGGGGGNTGGGDNAGGGGRDRVRALPATGVGGVDAGLMSALAGAGAAAAAGLGLRRR